jgi:aspartyl-tRNA(Asn)/glutamyl-tRNA(Gln) amidotransferase subunit A
VTLAQASAADARIAAGERTPLLGVPIAHKDIFVTKDFPSTAGSKMLEGYRSPFDATVVRKLAERRHGDLGKLNCDEFAMGSANENSAYKPVQEPLGHEPHSRRLLGRQRRGRGRAPGAGRHRHRHRRLDPPARSVLRHHRHQADLWPLLALRHDRLRLQPGPGRPDGAQRRGLRAAAVGICGPDPDRDSTSLDTPAEDFTPRRRWALRSGLRIGLPKEFFGEGCAPTCVPPSRRAEASTKSWAPSWWRSRCRAPSCRSPCTTSSRRPRRAPT